MNTDVKIQGLRITAPFVDGSGYAQGARNWLKGLHKLGVPMWLNVISFEQDRPDLKDDAELIDALARTPRQCDVNFVRLSPEVGIQFLAPDMINILSCAWETSALDPHWTECCNNFDAVFVESEWSRGVFKSSGVKVPIFVVPNCVDVNKYRPKVDVSRDKYTFYSIQQWTERKNAIGLLKAYFNAFTPDDSVMLVLKTYLTRMENVPDQHNIIKSQIDSLKKSLNYKRPYPPIYLITEKLTDEEIVQLHEESDCYVLLDRGEGLGLPYMEAAAAANPIIATNWGGSRQFLNEENSYTVDYQLSFVENMAFSPFYHGDIMQWADPNLPQAAAKMRYVFDNRETAFALGKQARSDMKEKFNESVITKTLLGAIAEVVANKRK